MLGMHLIFHISDLRQETWSQRNTVNQVSAGGPVQQVQFENSFHHSYQPCAVHWAQQVILPYHNLKTSYDFKI